MIRVIHGSDELRLRPGCVEGEALWCDSAQLEAATGWRWKPEGLCRDATCVPVPRAAAPTLVRADRIDAAGLWRHLGWPVAHDASGERWVLGESAASRAEALTSLEAPDFALPDLAGRVHRLSAHRGKRVFLATWASWCGCRADLAAWQALQAAAGAGPFVVVAVALDEPEAARPWIEAAAPSFPCLVDREHRIAELYNFVNVPQAVWIDEAGRIVRPPETAGSTDGFRAMDRARFVTPPEILEERQRVKRAYFDAVLDWAARGAASRFALGADQVLARLALPDARIAEAHAHFSLGQRLLADGLTDEAAAELAEACRLHPDSWAMWRQAAAKDAHGLAVGDDFWRRVDALGERRYYAPVELGTTPAAT